MSQTGHDFRMLHVRFMESWRMLFTVHTCYLLWIMVLHVFFPVWTGLHAPLKQQRARQSSAAGPEEFDHWG